MNTLESKTQLLDLSESLQADLIYISGKTCTGKSTLAKYLAQERNAGIIELDQVVKQIEVESGIDPFVEAYRRRSDMPIVKEFIERTQLLIKEQGALTSVTIFEGALANSQTLLDIIEGKQDHFMFVYLLPVDKVNYRERIIQRYVLSYNANLPSGLAKNVDIESLKTFYTTRHLSLEVENAIDRFVEESIAKAEQRLRMFEQSFNNIFVLEV